MTRKGLEFYPSSTLLQVPRIRRANEQVTRELRQKGIPVYDSSIVHAARPEATRDKMHWGRVSGRPSDAQSDLQRCHAYCSGKWAGLGNFAEERDSPILAFWSMQIALSMIKNAKVKRSGTQ